MRYISGDGEWIVMTMCPALNSQQRNWAYSLFVHRWDAEAYLEEINGSGCNKASGDKNCFGRGNHRIWRLT
jgi:hypothetical protein